MKSKGYRKLANKNQETPEYDLKLPFGELSVVNSPLAECSKIGRGMMR
jgi:hypothetical protein